MVKWKVTIPCLLSTSINAVNAVPLAVHSSTGADKLPTWRHYERHIQEFRLVMILTIWQDNTKLNFNRKCKINSKVKERNKRKKKGARGGVVKQHKVKREITTDRWYQPSFPTVQESTSSITQCIAVASVKVTWQTTSPFVPTDMKIT